VASVPGTMAAMSHNLDDRVADLVTELRSISEVLNDLAMDAVRSAIDAGENKRPEMEKKLSAARRAVEKAVRSLDRTEGGLG